MKILHTVEFYEPLKGGSEEVVRRISEHLAARGHEVTVATTHHAERTWTELNGVKVRGFAVRGNAARGITGDAQAYQEFIRSDRFDVILNFGAQTWTTDLTLPILSEVRCRKFLAPVGYSKLHHRRYRKYFRGLPGYLAHYDGLVYNSVNYRDWQFGDRHGLRHKSVIIPNGASREEFAAGAQDFRQRYGITGRHMFLSVSNHYFAKGHRFILDAFHRGATADCSLVIVGSRPHGHPWYSCHPICSWAAARDRRVILLSNLSREDVVGAYREADLFLFGSRVECSPLVMYESFAGRTPFITRNVGNVADHSDCLRLVDSSEGMAREIERYIADPEPYRTLAERAHALFLRDHSWDRIAERFERLYTSGLSK
jgi:glycosyltransferase involved in cell wall biosynthesis